MSKKKKKWIFNNYDTDFLKMIIEICANLSNKNLCLKKIAKMKLFPYKKHIKELSNCQCSLNHHRKVVQKGGAPFMLTLLSTLAPILIEKLASLKK